MITKLHPTNYLKRRDNMEVQERVVYNQMLALWHETMKPMLVAKLDEPAAAIYGIGQLSGSWNEKECHAFEQGALLMSALTTETDTWLPDMIYTKTARRVIRRMISVLDAAAQTGNLKDLQDPQGPIDLKDPKDLKDPQTASPAPAAPGQQGGVGAYAPSGVKRPRHIDQYIHLMPEATQQRAAGVKDILRRLEEARQKMQTLIDGGGAHTDTQATWAREATRLDNELHSIYQELDREWDNLVKAGRVYVDDLGNAHVTPAEQQRLDAAAAEEQARAKAERKKNPSPGDMRRWLCDTRRGNGKTRDVYAAKWGEKFEAYAALVGAAAYADKKIQAAAKHYGVKIKARKS